ncbi:hypothetical protein ACJ41O_007813 [Fusarium nematophilum]
MDEKPQMWSTHDLACAHCRTRKIRCGRERPQCESCKRDGVECRYSSPGKRINHVKLLCQNFEALEDQLNSIQSDLSALTSLVKSGNAGKSLPVSGEDWLEDILDGGGATDTRKDRHIVRDEQHLVDRYHGPSSLYTLCKEFHDDPIFETSEADAILDNDIAIRIMLQQLLTDAGKEEYLDIPSEHTGICLPPRQFLSIVVGQFFKNADYATDIFVRSNFQVHLDRVYSQPLKPSDEGWAVCFNVIVLLAIRKDQTNQGNNSFIQPFLQTLRMAVNNPRVFLTPRLVNVQALALLSYIAEQYSTAALADLVFAQACLLARTMGLHQSRASAKGIPSEELLERQKVFRSLYIRDKNSAICQGSTAWLPAYESTITRLPGSLGGDEAKYAARIELAQIQHDIYRHLHAVETADLPSSKHSQLVSHLEQKLEHWAATQQINKVSPTSAESATLLLSFFATRICVLKGSDQAFRDAKASCILFLLATTPHPDPGLVETFDELFSRARSCSPLSAKKAEESSDECPQARTTASDEAEIRASLIPRLATSFPLAAAFIVAKGILQQPMTAPDEPVSQPEKEILLLEALRDRYVSAAHQEGVGNLASRLCRTLDSLARIVRQKRSPEGVSTPSIVFNELSSHQSTASSASQRASVGRSLKGTPPGPEAPSTVVSVGEAVSTSSLLLPFMQPLDSPSSCSPWLGNAGHGGASSAMVLSPWPGSYKQQSDGQGRVGKRPRQPSQAELFDIATGFPDHGPRAEEDPLFTFDFLTAGNDIAIFEVDE